MTSDCLVTTDRDHIPGLRRTGSSMIEPETSGALLASAIRDARPAPGHAAVWRLGQSGVVIRFPEATVLIDAYLSNHCEAVLGGPFDHRRLTRAPLDPVELDSIDVVICSHDHLDHLDPPTMRTIARQNPDATVLAPRAALPTLRGLGWQPERIVACDDGTHVEVGALRVESFAVPHDDFDADEVGFPYLGWIVSDKSTRVAHLGDSRAHPDVVAALATRPVDLLAVPINGRTAERAALGFAGNMSAPEAVALASAAGASLTLPLHYDMFDQNVDAHALDAFRHAAEQAHLDFVILPVGREFDLQVAR